MCSGICHLEPWRCVGERLLHQAVPLARCLPFLFPDPSARSKTLFPTLLVLLYESDCSTKAEDGSHIYRLDSTVSVRSCLRLAQHQRRPCLACTGCLRASHCLHGSKQCTIGLLCPLATVCLLFQRKHSRPPAVYSLPCPFGEVETATTTEYRRHPNYRFPNRSVRLPHCRDGCAGDA